MLYNNPRRRPRQERLGLARCAARRRGAGRRQLLYNFPITPLSISCFTINPQPYSQPHTLNPRAQVDAAETALSSELFFSSLLLSSLELIGTTICEPSIRALLETASHFCQLVVLKLRGAGRRGRDGAEQRPTINFQP